jgi:hypothetical protein
LCDLHSTSGLHIAGVLAFVPQAIHRLSKGVRLCND